MRALLDAISHMHDHGISHRDVKLENLVLARPSDLASVTIVDFGLAKAARMRQQMRGVVGTTNYCAPEILRGRPYTPVVDSWSLGVVMYLLLTGALLYRCGQYLIGVHRVEHARRCGDDQPYCALEILRGRLYTPVVDSVSFGVDMYAVVPLRASFGSRAQN